MRNLIINIFVLGLLIGCTTSKTVSEKLVIDNSYADSLNAFNKAADAFIKGNVLEMKGNFAEAIIEYQEALNIKESSGIHNALAKSYLAIDKLPKALEHSRRAVKLDSTNTDYLMMLAEVYSDANLADSSSRVYEKIIGLDSTNYQAYFYLGQLYEAAKPRKALTIYERLLKETGPEWNVLLRVADLNERLGNVDKTISTVEDLLNLDPSNIQLQKLLIDSYIKSGKNEEALVLIDDIIPLFPDDISLIEYRGKALIEMKRWEEGSEEYIKLTKDKRIPFVSRVKIATAFLNEANKDSTLTPIAKKILKQIDADSTDWQIKAFLGEIAIKENDDSTALKYFKASAENAEWNVQVSERLGILLFDNQKYEMAIEEMGKAVVKFPNSFVVNIILGLSLAQQNRHEEAEIPLKKAIDINPTDLTGLHAYGYTLNQLKKNTEAIKYLERALILDGQNVQIMGTLGLIYESDKVFQKSDSLYLLALSIDSTNALILNNYAYSLSERDIELQKAKKMSQTALDKDPENSSYLDTYGWILYKLGDYTNAILYVQKAIDKESDNATLVDHLADIYFKMGDKKKAVELWRKALQLNGSLEKVKQKLAQESM